MTCNPLVAQIFRFGVPNMEAYDKDRFHFGFSLGIDIVDVNLKTKSNYVYPQNISKGNEVTHIYSKSTPAFNVGILVNMRLGDYFDIRFIPGFSIAHDLNLYYQFTDKILDPNPKSSDGWTDLILRKIECHFINFPLLIQFKSSRMHNLRVYVFGGAQVGINMMSAKNNKIPRLDPQGFGAEIIPIIKPYDVQVKGGLGFNFYTTYFKFSTEFKVAFGVINMLENAKNIKDKEQIDAYHTSPIITGLQSLKSKTFTVSFIIE
jgi:hypothetical protein